MYITINTILIFILSCVHINRVLIAICIVFQICICFVLMIGCTSCYIITCIIVWF